MKKRNKKNSKKRILEWTAKGIALFSLIFGLPFYFGYGNPMPFINPNYSLWDNTWLTIFPLMFLGLALGFKWKKIGGYLITIPLTIGLIFGIITEGELLWFMLIPLIAGIMYLVLAYKKF